MPTHRLRKRLLDRLIQSATSAGELGLALLMTAGVVHCGGSTQTKGEGTGDAAVGCGMAVEAACDAGVIVEAVNDSSMVPDGVGGDGSPHPMVEAPAFQDGGTDGQISPIIEAPAPPPDSGNDARGPIVEAATFPDSGPWVEAPVTS
jgi:hypothetical protein